MRISARPVDGLAGGVHPACGSGRAGGRPGEVEVFVGGDAWLERLLLRLGPDARVVDQPEYRTLAAEAAARILSDRYRH